MGSETQTHVNFAEQSATMCVPQMQCYSQPPMTNNNLKVANLDKDCVKNGGFVTFDKFAWQCLDKSSAFSKTKNIEATKSDDYSNNIASNFLLLKL